MTELSILAVCKPMDGIQGETTAGALQVTCKGSATGDCEHQLLVQEIAARKGQARKSPGFFSSH